MKSFRRNRKGGSVVFAIVMTIVSLAVTSMTWFVFYPMVEAIASLIDTTGNTNAALFEALLMNTWTWLGVICMANIFLWSFAYTVKRDWESQYQ